MKKHKPKKHSEEHKFLKLMKKIGAPVDTFTDPQCIYSDALNRGAVVEHCVKRANFAFSKRGKFIGCSDEGINSFTKRIVK